MILIVHNTELIDSIKRWIGKWKDCKRIEGPYEGKLDAVIICGSLC